MSYYADYLKEKCDQEHWGEEVEWKPFYTDIFDIANGGLPDEDKRFEKNTYLAILLTVGPEKNEIRKRLVNATMKPLAHVINHPRAGTTSFISPIIYAGKNKTIENARFLFAVCIEVDDLLEETDENGQVHFVGLEHLIAEWEAGNVPKPTYIVSSGNGVHLYYQFVEKLPIYRPNERKFMELRRGLTNLLWQAGLSTSKVQIESTVQGFRVVGSITKSGKICRAFKIGGKITLDYLNLYVPEEYRALDLQMGPKNCTREYAQEHYPEWWAEQQEKKRKRKEEGPGHFLYNRGLYDRWKERIMDEVVVGHRAGCMMTLAIDAIKCGISKEELIEDIKYFSAYFDSLSTDENNRFTLEEGMQALKYYDPAYYSYPMSSISYRSGIEIVPAKRNYYSLDVHLENCRKLAAKVNSRREAIREWRLAHPDGTKAQCCRDTGCDKKTVRKWWDICLDRRKKFHPPKAKPVKTKHCQCCGKEVPFYRETGKYYNTTNHFVYDYVTFRCEHCMHKVGGYSVKTNEYMYSRKQFTSTYKEDIRIWYERVKMRHAFWEDREYVSSEEKQLQAEERKEDLRMLYEYGMTEEDFWKWQDEREAFEDEEASCVFEDDYDNDD